MSDINVTVQDEIVNIDVLDTPVLVNVVNSPGQQGPAGPGVPVGGTEGQILAKASATNYDTEWINNYAKYLATNVRNQTGSTIGAFKVVYISGATGNKPLISLADADTEATSSKTYGVTATSIANNGTGDVVTVGELSGIDTSAFNEGDLLWLSTTAGGVVTSPPAEPAHSVFIGTVIRSHPTLGVIDVAIQNGYELTELHGVEITTPTANQGLFYDGSLWVNRSITTALGYTPANAATTLTINGVTYDLSTSRTWTIAAGISGSGASGQVTYWTGASAVSGSNNLFWDASNGRLGIGTNAPRQSLHISKTTGANIYLEDSDFTSTHNITSLSNNNGNFQISTLTSIGGFVSTDYNIAKTSTTTIHSWYKGDNSLSMRLYNTGNLLIQSSGTFTDNGQRLQVYGDTLLRGSGATSATTALTVQNSDSTNMFRVRNDGNTFTNFGSYIGSSNQNVILAADATGANSASGLNLKLLFGSFSTAGYGVYIQGFNAGTRTATSGESGTLNVAHGFAPTSGTGTYTMLNVVGTINQTGGANGITRGLYVNPTLTAAADWRSIEWSNNSGWGLYGAGTANNYLAGNLGIGITPTVRLHVSGDTILRGSGATGSTNALIVQNSAGSNALSVTNGLAVTIHQDLYLGNTVLLWISGSQIRNTANGVLRICDSTGANFTRLQFGGTSTSFPALERSGASICVMDATGAAGANLSVGTTSVNASAILQADSTTKGFLPPRMTTTQKNAISSPAAGLVVYDTTLNKLCVYTTAWETITSI